VKDFDYDKTRAMKHKDFKPCAYCGKGVAHSGVPMFYRVTIERMGIDARAVERQTGLEMMLGGNAMLANVMGPDADIGIPIGEADKGLLCAECAHNACLSFMGISGALAKEQK
jgi:hypothetical protein